MYQLFYTNKFKKDVKLLKKRGYDIIFLKKAIISLEATGTLPKNCRPHKLKGHFSGYLEAHLKPDWLIIWKVFDDWR